MRFQFSGPSTNARVRLRLRFVSSPASAVQAARGLGHSPGVRRSFSLCGPSARRRSGLRKSLDRNRGLFAGWEEVASLGLSLPLSPLPASYLQRGLGGSSLEFLSPFVLRTAAVCSGRSIFLSLSHSLKKSPSHFSQGPLAGPYPKECRRLLSVPPPLAGGVCGCGRLGVLFCWELLLGT